MQRWSIDFKGPLRSSSQNTYMLTMVDEYSRLLFASPCSNTTSATVMKCLNKLCVLCGTRTYVHSDRGSLFLSQEIKDYFSQRSIATSKTFPCHPIGNGQYERYNGVICKGVRMVLKTQNLSDTQWEIVLPNVLYYILSLLSTATNTTPHDILVGFQSISPCGSSLPTWLSASGNVMLGLFVRTVRMIRS